jgi:FKBP-type peptidyl-prolyl cis-trans isomerase
MKWIPCASLAALLALTAGCTTPEQPGAGGDGGHAAANAPAEAPHAPETPPTADIAAGPPAAPAKVNPKDYKTLEGGLKYAILKPGTGEAAKPGQTARMHYTGWLENGTMFDSSMKPGRDAFEFQLGQGMVIPGWDKGIPGMKVGEKRQLRIPSEMGYGAMGSPPNIPPNSTLIFDVELLGLH